MSSRQPYRFSRVPGRIVVDPTTAFATTSFPYGGTEIGAVQGFALMPYQKGEPYKVWCELLGTHSDVLEPAEEALIGFVARGWDDDRIHQLFTLNDGTGTVTQHATYTAPGTQVPGASALGRSVKLLFVPDDTVSQDALICYDATPFWTPGAESIWSRSQEKVLPIQLHLTRNSSGNLWQTGRIEDLSLT